MGKEYKNNQQYLNSVRKLKDFENEEHAVFLQKSHNRGI